MNQKEVVEKVHEMLIGQRFFDWYKDDFEDYITGEENCKNKEQILKDLQRLLRLDK